MVLKQQQVLVGSGCFLPAARVTVGNNGLWLSRKAACYRPRRAGEQRVPRIKAEGASTTAEVAKGASHSAPPIVKSKGLTLGGFDRAVSQREQREKKRANSRGQ